MVRMQKINPIHNQRSRFVTKLNSAGMSFLLVALLGCNMRIEPSTKNDSKNELASNNSKKSKVDLNDISRLKDVDVSTLQEGFGVGDLAPDISGQDAQGVTFSLSEYHGKVIMLDFWGDW